MKTTVKVSRKKGITVLPTQNGRVLIGMDSCRGTMAETWEGFADLTPDQCGALIFGMEQALEVIDQRHRAALETMREEA
jgi:hypothetical protein